MKINHLGKSKLTAVIFFTATSIAFAQTDQDSTKSKDIEQVVLTGVADIAKDRKTPVAVSTIKEAQIVEKLGNQEFPEILNTTPSVYATKGGGGFGDGRINIRGFANENIAVMINGVPVNDMENGAVFWSNWAGLSDVTSAMQIQRGLGASKLAIASVGGTINIITRAADKKQGGVINIGVANDGYHKSLFSYNTGKNKRGWSTSFLMSRTAGSMYFDGSKFESYNYYFALGYQKPGSNHDFQFTFTGAPQWHFQNFANSITNDTKYGGTNDKPNRKYNSNWGYLNGEEFSQTINFYSKPVMSLNWDWKMSSSSKLSTVVYASFGRGGGTGILGAINGKSINTLSKTTDGLIRFDDIVKWNQGGTISDFGVVRTNPNGSLINTSSVGITQRANINSHNWYGVLSSFNHKLTDDLNFTVGIDGRYYYGYHPGLVTNFLGANGYFEKGNLNQQPGYLVTQNTNPQPSANPFAKVVKDESQIANRNYNGEVIWYGGFGQLEYSKNNISAFVSGALSNQGYQRIDNWIVDGITTQNGQVVHRKTGMKNLIGYNGKAGVNINLDSYNNVFGNIGYISKQPFLTAVYPNNKQTLNPNLTNEKIFSAELGYGFKSSNFRANVNLYRTQWKDRFQRRTVSVYDQTTNVVLNNAYAEISGIQEIHYGAEFDANYKINDYLDINGMFSWGDWRYKGNAAGSVFDDNNNPIASANGSNVTILALDNAKVGNAAQITSSIDLTWKPAKGLKIGPSWRFAGNLYANVSINDFALDADRPNYLPPAARYGTLRLPDYNLFDAFASYMFDFKNNKSLTLSANIYNIFDTYYISEATTNILPGLTQADFVNKTISTTGVVSYSNNTTAFNNYVAAGSWNGINKQNQVFFGFGRTWSASISYKF